MTEITKREQFYIDQNAAGENGWKTAIMDELSTCMIYQDHHEDNPSKALEDCIQWNVDVALDPQVSKAAADLIEHGKTLANIGKPFVDEQTCKSTGAIFFGSALFQLGVAIFDKNPAFLSTALISLGAAWMSYVAYRNATK